MGTQENLRTSQHVACSPQPSRDAWSPNRPPLYSVGIGISPPAPTNGAVVAGSDSSSGLWKLRTCAGHHSALKRTLLSRAEPQASPAQSPPWGPVRTVPNLEGPGGGGAEPPSPQRIQTRPTGNVSPFPRNLLMGNGATFPFSRELVPERANRQRLGPPPLPGGGRGRAGRGGRGGREEERKRGDEEMRR